MSSPKILISFILLTYKQERFVRQAVEGALSQNYFPMEIIISDDASPDGTFDIVQEIAASYKGPHKIILNRNPRNLGISSHLHKAFSLTSGEWIVTAAGDDVSFSERISKSAEFVKSNQNLLAMGCGYLLLHEDGSPMSEISQHQVRRPDLKGSAPIDLLRNAFMGGGGGVLYGCSAMYHRSLFERFEATPDNLHWEDQVMAFRALIQGQLDFLEDRLVGYRIHGGNITSGTKSGRVTPAMEEMNLAKLISSNLPVFEVWERDLLHANRMGTPLIVSNSDASRFIDHWKENRWVRANWWSLSYRKRLLWLTRGIIARRLLPIKFMIVRMLPFSFFAIMPNWIYRKFIQKFT